MGHTFTFVWPAVFCLQTGTGQNVNSSWVPSEKMTLFKWEAAGTTALAPPPRRSEFTGSWREFLRRVLSVTPRFCARKRARIIKREVSPEEQCVLTSVRLTCSTELMYVGVYPIRM